MNGLNVTSLLLINMLKIGCPKKVSRKQAEATITTRKQLIENNSLPTFFESSL
jgi:hypothetical protein